MKQTRISISIEEYNKLCDIAIEKGKSVEDTLMELLEVFTKVEISKVKIVKDKEKTSKIHDINK